VLRIPSPPRPEPSPKLAAGNNLKAFLTWHSIEFPNTHNLIDLRWLAGLSRVIFPVAADTKRMIFSEPLIRGFF
jgi:hypothetical protein